MNLGKLPAESLGPADEPDLVSAGVLPEAGEHGPVQLAGRSLPVVEQLDKFATELVRLAGGLTIETLRKQAESADAPNRTTRP
jgi:hypothetical protein